MSTSKVASMRHAVESLVRDGDTVAIEGFTHLISFAAGHEACTDEELRLIRVELDPDGAYTA